MTIYIISQSQHWTSEELCHKPIITTSGNFEQVCELELFVAVFTSLNEYVFHDW